MYIFKRQLSGLFFILGSILSSASNADLTIEDKNLRCEIMDSELHITMELSQDAYADDQLNVYLWLPRGGWGSIYFRRLISQDIPLIEIQSLKLPVPSEWESSGEGISPIQVAIATRSFLKPEDKLSMGTNTKCEPPKEE